MNRLSKYYTTTSEGLGIIHSTSTRSDVSFTDQWRDIFIEASRVSGKFGYKKNKI